MMDEERIEDKVDHMLEQPLTKEDGSLNEACMDELAAVLDAIPRTYDRLSGDPEWNTPRVTNVKEITGAFALWSVRQGGYKCCPPNLEKLVSYLDTCLRKEFNKRDGLWAEEGWGKFSLCEINKLLFDILWDLPTFLEWNTEECLGKDWLDLEALLHNVCLAIRSERRENDEFDRKFEEEHNGSQSV